MAVRAKEPADMDAIIIAAVTAFFTLTWGLARLCGRFMGGGPRDV
jgi:hypothetical protein